MTIQLMHCHRRVSYQGYPLYYESCSEKETINDKWVINIECIKIILR